MKSLREQRKKQRAKPQKTLLIAGVSALAIFFVGLGGWYGWQRTHSNAAPSVEQSTTDEAAVKTQTVPQADSTAPSGSAKDTTPEPGANPQAPTNTKKQVQPVLSYAGYVDATNQQVEVDAFVPSLVEEGGTCTLIATKDSQKVTVQTTGHTNVSQTRCDNFVIERSRFPTGGTWSVVVSYDSATAQGSSAAQNMEL